jgi:hypothetical protein
VRVLQTLVSLRRMGRMAKHPTDKQMERARNEGECSLQIDVGKEFLQWVKIEAAKRGLSNRDFVIQALLKDGEDEF